MPFWSWIIIWGGLVLVLLAMLGFLGYRLFVKLVAALDALGELSEKTALLDAAAEDLAAERFHPAVFADAAELSHARRVEKAARRRRREALREKRVVRGRILVNADPQQYSHLLRKQ
jgi:hypothetical protein